MAVKNILRMTTLMYLKDLRCTKGLIRYITFTQ